MLFTSKTNETVDTTAEESQSTGKLGIFKNIVIIAGTAAGIGGAIFGAKKLHEKVSQKYLEDFDDDFDFSDDGEDEPDGTTATENQETVEDFKEVETEETINEAPVSEFSETEVTESADTLRLKEIGKVLGAFEFNKSTGTGMSVLKDLEKIDDSVMVDLLRILRDDTITDSERKLGESIRSDFLNEIGKVLDVSEEILTSSDVTSVEAKSLYGFLNQIRWDIASVNTSEVKERILSLRDLALEKSEGETKTSDTSSNETQVEDEPTTGETQTVVDDNQVLEDCIDIVETLDDSDGRKVSDDDLVGCIEKLEGVCKKYPNRKSMENLSKATIDAIKMARTSVGRGICHYSDDVSCRMNELVFARELQELHDSLAKVVAVIDKADSVKKYTAANTYRNDMLISKIRIERRIKKVTDSGETKTESKPEGENQTSETPLTYTMSEKVAEAVKVGDEIQAPISATTASEKEAQEIMRIINDIPDRKTPEKNDLPYITRCIGGHIAKIDTDEISSEILADLRNSVIVFTDMIDTAIEHLASDSKSDVYTLGNMNKIHDEFVASNILSILGKDSAKTMLQGIENKISAFSEKIKSLKAETAVAKEEVSEEPAETSSPNAEGVSELSAKLKHISTLVKTGKWSDAKAYYKNELVEYLADDHISEDLRLQIEAINTNITNHLMEEKQEANQQQTNISKKKGNKNSKKSSRRYSKR